MNRTLDPKHRAAMRRLVLGAVEHCEISRHLIGSIAQTFTHDGVKYGIPAFTFFGPQENDVETRFVGLMAGRRAGDGLSAEVTLQLMERLLLQPGFAAGLWLRTLPIINPVGLEDPESLAPAYEPAVLRLNLECPDGVIEVSSTRRKRLVIGMRSDWSGRGGALAAADDMNRLSAELGGIEREEIPPTQLPYNARSPWHLYLGFPETWSSNQATHLASQYLLCFFRRWRELSLTEQSRASGRH
ncbi:hypothetical protein H5P28_18350 [Ruficoccus amylovorans]|uniref:Peptidase M14 carboxypeptidase A domain-containing protein n=1 Tax=Ruficoccus amylovorans TaxID=1804625 RepID=A0A842HKN7_9BACT|nr:hypothetical protein [Ruficoccus amylovorans]MBC2596234.1 hypothetical protein [Ruficoccus amylovorans]